MRLAVPVRVRWSDLDAYGHVNNAALLTLLEEARVSAFWAGGTAAGTVGAAGAASALPANPTGYLSISINGTVRKVPYYAT